MKKIRFYALTAFLLITGNAFAQSLQDQIGAVASTISEQKAEEEIAKAKEQKKIEAQEAAKKKAFAEAKKREQAQLKALQAEKSRLKQRDENYEDSLRSLEIEEKRLELEAKRARVKRTDEYIDQELKAQAAKTDVVQSEADATRNVSSGISENLKSKGKAEENKAKSWFK